MPLLAAAAPGPAYFPGQTVYPSSAPIIVPTAPQQPPPAKREKKPVRVSQLAHNRTVRVYSGCLITFRDTEIVLYYSAVRQNVLNLLYQNVLILFCFCFFIAAVLTVDPAVIQITILYECAHLNVIVPT